MLQDVLQTIQSTGLEVHEGKTEVLCNSIGRGAGTSSYVTVGAYKFQIMRENECTSYLGRSLSCQALHE
eukprot:11338567-Karenia_brevis.AAC.1